MPKVPERRPGLFVIDLGGAMIGIVRLGRREGGRPGHVRPDAGEVELSYLFLPDAWGRGYASEACSAALDWVTNSLPCEPVVLCTQTANNRSMRLASKLGFTEVERFIEFGAEQWFGVLNDLQLVRRVMADLEAAGFEPLLFGGWGEEVLGLAAPRQHEDVDVLLVDPPLSELDAFVAARDEIVDAHLSHKRVYRHDGVKIELFIARRVGDSLETVFWDRLQWRWPDDMRRMSTDGLPLASAAAFLSFRDGYADFMAARDAAVSHDGTKR